MFTSIDKALIAVIMAGAYLLNEFTGLNIGLDESVVSAFVVGITPILVWAIPNREEP